MVGKKSVDLIKPRELPSATLTEAGEALFRNALGKAPSSALQGLEKWDNVLNQSSFVVYHILWRSIHFAHPGVT